MQIPEVFRKNIVPVVLVCAGAVLLLFGVFQILIRSNSDSAVNYEPGQASPKSSEELMVDVEGAVVEPGVYKVKDNSRFVDALAAAGGLSEDADRSYVQKNINLAQKLTDGVKIYIPRRGEEVKAAASSGLTEGSGGPVININTASAAQLDSLPGVGSVTSAKIIEGRPYSDIVELVERKIVGQATFEKIKDKISAN